MKPMTSSPPLLFLLALFAFLAVSGMVACNPVSASSENQPPTAVPTHASPTATATQLPQATFTPPPTPTAAPTAVSTLVPTPPPPQFTNIRDDAWAQTAVTYNAEFFPPRSGQYRPVAVCRQHLHSSSGAGGAPGNRLFAGWRPRARSESGPARAAGAAAGSRRCC
ncbi:MAG: hypothetical protein IPF56_14000 [Chloroflexi bacterium]|nr:hypothetical protein [Chloroflexota bacterium]